MVIVLAWRSQRSHRPANMLLPRQCIQAQYPCLPERSGIDDTTAQINHLYYRFFPDGIGPRTRATVVTNGESCSTTRTSDPLFQVPTQTMGHKIPFFVRYPPFVLASCPQWSDRYSTCRLSPMASLGALGRLTAPHKRYPSASVWEGPAGDEGSTAPRPFREKGTPRRKSPRLAASPRALRARSDSPKARRGSLRGGRMATGRLPAAARR